MKHDGDTWVTVGYVRRLASTSTCQGASASEGDGALQAAQRSSRQLLYRCRSEIVEGVIVEENSVISMGVYISQSTKIYDRATGEVSYGRIPAGSVVVSGNLPSADGKYSLYCAVIVKKVDAGTRAKTAINELLRL